jgi:hypothetical protein
MDKFSISKFLNETTTDPIYFFSLYEFIKEYEESSVNGIFIPILSSANYKTAEKKYNSIRKQYRMAPINYNQVYSNYDGAVHYIPLNFLP